MSDDNILVFRPKRAEMPSPSSSHRFLDENGVEWFKFMLQYSFGESMWVFEIWAQDLADAEMRLNAIRETATVDGQIYETVPVS